MRSLLLGVISLTCSQQLLRCEEMRASQIERARDEKEGELTPYEQPKAERRWISARTHLIEPVFGKSDGPHLRLGSMASASGFALGPEYARSDLLGGNLSFRVGARGSIRKWYQGVFELSAPRLFNELAFVNFNVVNRNYGSMQYYGPGPGSKKTGRSDYRLEDTNVEVRPGIRPFRGFEGGLIGGFLASNVGPGDRSTFISTERQFGPEAAPGIDHQTSFWRGGGFAQFDWRNYPEDTTRGGFYSAQYIHSSDRSLGSYSFGRLDIDARQFIPFFNEKRVIAIRSLSSLTTTSGGQRVPFYMQPTLGGSNDLRGYRPYRFYGDNRIATTAEYRWEASSALSMAVFVDAGKVFDRWSQWNLHDLQTSYGFGFRFKDQHTPVLRVDTAFSREGFQIWVRFNNAF